MSTTVLLTGDEPRSGRLPEQLRRDGFEIAGPGGRPDVVIAGTGAEVERWCREAPVIVLGRDGARPGDGVLAFRRGCDDYVAPPFDYEELVERIRAVLRRTRLPEPRLIVAGPVVVDERCRVASLDGVPLRLAQKEFTLLAKLATDPGRVFTKAELLREIWGYHSPGRTRTLDSHASRLRRKLRALDPETPYVDNEWGVGYRLVGPFP